MTGKRRRTRSTTESEHGDDLLAMKVEDPVVSTQISVESSNRVEESNGMVVEQTPAIVAERSTVWYEDGNVILEVAQVYFRVHRTILEKRSKVLADILSEGSTHIAEGCPVYALAGDSEADVEYMLSALYGDKGYTNVRKALPMDVVAAMIRMGHKYKIDYLREEGQIRLQKEFPSSLYAWATKVDRTDLENVYDPAGFPTLVLKAIEVALECKMETVLPTLYFEALRTITAHPLQHTDVKYALAKTYSGLLVAYSEFLDARADIVYGWIGELGDIPSCEHKHKCVRASRDLAGILWQSQQGLASAFWTWNEVRDLYDLTRKLCHECRSHAKLVQEAGRVSLWKKLPEFFGLGSWEELKDFEE